MLSGEEFNRNLDRACEQLRAGLNLEALLCELRQKGADKIDCIRIVKASMNLTMAQSKSLVDRSDTWSDRYANDQHFHEAVREVAEKLKCESSGTEVVIEARSTDPDCL